MYDASLERYVECAEQARSKGMNVRSIGHSFVVEKCVGNLEEIFWMHNPNADLVSVHCREVVAAVSHVYQFPIVRMPPVVLLIRRREQGTKRGSGSRYL